jgi:ABC-type antimicrobial peptide transport system permease subunit
VLGVFASLAFVLALVGVYGVISYAVAQRTREFGVRMALGATGGRVLRLVLAEGARLAGFGVVIGGAAALVATKALSGLLYGVAATDPLTFALVPALLVIIALLATLFPARRATRVDPGVALRAD